MIERIQQSLSSYFATSDSLRPLHVAVRNSIVIVIANIEGNCPHLLHPVATFLPLPMLTSEVWHYLSELRCYCISNRGQGYT